MKFWFNKKNKKKKSEQKKPFLPVAIQTNTATLKNRYGYLFPFVQSLTKVFEVKSSTILSYGCSTGEELLTLRSLFPDSKIIGVDINVEALKLAQENCKHDANIEIMDSEIFWHNEVKFDLVFCMSVFCVLAHEFIPKAEWKKKIANPETKQEITEVFAKNLPNRFSFEDFEKLIQQFDGKMNKGALFTLFNVNYSLMDTSLSNRYELIIIPGINLETQPKCTKNYKPIIQNDYSEIIFRKKY